MTEKRFKITKENYEYFKKMFVKWQETFGLLEWSVEFTNDNIDSGLRASIYMNTTSRKATANLETTWLLKPTKQRLEQSACHELLEMFLVDIGNKAEDSWNSVMVESEVHKIINRLMAVLKVGV